MNSKVNFLKRHLLVIGIVLMFLFTWPIDLANEGLLPFKVPFLVYLFLSWGFVRASVTMTGLTLGREGVISLLGNQFNAGVCHCEPVKAKQSHLSEGDCSPAPGAHRPGGSVPGGAGVVAIAPRNDRINSSGFILRHIQCFQLSHIGPDFHH
jgi:hypothetical protein